MVIIKLLKILYHSLRKEYKERIYLKKTEKRQNFKKYLQHVEGIF